MKTRNQFFGLIAMAIIAITALSMTGCKQEDDPVLCKCPNGTEHLFGQSCCDGTDCKCVIYYGTLPNTAIKIYKGDTGVTDVQMNTAVTTVTTAYGRLTQAEKTAVNNTLTKIRIISDTDYRWDGHILELRFDIDGEDLLGGLQAIAGNTLPHSP